MKIVSRARAEKFSIQTQRVFLYCTAADVSEREMLVGDLLSNDAGMDCVVLYVDPPDAPRDETLLENELRGAQALILWVTKDLLESIRADGIPAEYRLAQKLHLPVLPIAKFDALLPEFMRQVAPVHAIARSDPEYRTTDPTKVSKLKAQLEAFLGSESPMRDIREKAFTSKIFLSYRKMDIHEARRFMNILHDIEGLEAVSIWYDHFLTVGKDFNEEIKNAITTSDVFVQIVTPNMLQFDGNGKPNHVMNMEYPFARNKGKPVIFVEALPTDFETFARLFPGADKPVQMNDPVALRDTFRAKLGNTVTSTPMDSERAYYLGMAYLKRYGVERDFDRAIKLLKSAANECRESGLQATEQLVDIYENGIGIGIQYNIAFEWRKKVVTYSEQLLGAEHPDTASAYSNIAAIYGKQGDYTSALDWHRRALAIREKVLGKEHPDTATTYNNIAFLYGKRGDYVPALMEYRKALTIREKELGMDHPDTATTYDNIAFLYGKRGDHARALAWYQKALAVRDKVLGKEHSDTATTYNNIAFLYDKRGDHARALEWYRQALAIRENVLCKEHPDTATTYNNIAFLYDKQDDYAPAFEWYRKALAIRENVLGKEHPDTATTYNNIAFLYDKQGDYARAMEWYQKTLLEIQTPFKSYMGKEPYIFVSYAHANKDRVFLLIKQLHDKGYRIWYDEGIDPGTEFPKTIAEHIKNAAMMLLFVSPESVERPFVRREINYAQNKGIPIVSAILRETILPDELELQLGLDQMTFYYKYTDDAAFFEMLLRARHFKHCLF